MGCQESSAAPTSGTSGSRTKYDFDKKQKDDTIGGAAPTFGVEQVSESDGGVFDVATTTKGGPTTISVTTTSRRGSLFSQDDPSDGANLSGHGSLKSLKKGSSRKLSQNKLKRSPAAPTSSASLPHHVFRRNNGSCLLVVEDEYLNDVSQMEQSMEVNDGARGGGGLFPTGGGDLLMVPPHSIIPTVLPVPPSNNNNNNNSKLLAFQTSVSSNPWSTGEYPLEGSGLGGAAGGSTSELQQSLLLQMSRSFNGNTLSPSFNPTTGTPFENSNSLMELSRYSTSQQLSSFCSPNTTMAPLPGGLVNVMHPTVPVAGSHPNFTPQQQQQVNLGNTQQQSLMSSSQLAERDPYEVLDAFLLERVTYSPGNSAFEPEISPVSDLCAHKQQQQERIKDEELKVLLCGDLESPARNNSRRTGGKEDSKKDECFLTSDERRWVEEWLEGIISVEPADDEQQVVAEYCDDVVPSPG